MRETQKFWGQTLRSAGSFGEVLEVLGTDPEKYPLSLGPDFMNHEFSSGTDPANRPWQVWGQTLRNAVFSRGTAL